MNKTIIAARYARGLAEHALETQAIAEVREDIDGLADLLDPDRGEISAPELLDFLRSPTVPQSEKIQVTDVVCEKLSIGKIVSDFLNVLIEKNRIALVGLIAREYSRLASQMAAEQQVQVESAKALTAEQQTALQEALVAATGGKVRIAVAVNPELLGGLSIRLGDKLLDGSLTGRLHRLGTRLR